MGLVQLWKFGDRDGEVGYLIPHSIIREVVDLRDCWVYFFPELPCTEDNEKRIMKLAKDNEDYWEFEEKLDRNGIVYALASEDEEIPHEVLYYDWDHEDVGNFKYMVTTSVCYLNGKNFWLPFCGTSTVIEYEDDYEDLDSWNGSNYCYQAQFFHGELFKIISEDGIPSSRYLFKEWDQYEGTIPSGRIVEEDELDAIRNGSNDDE